MLRSLTLCSATLALAWPALASTDAGDVSPDTVTRLLDRIDQLESKVAELEGGGNSLTEQRATEIRALVQDVLADADSRASLQSSGMTAGWDKGFFLASPDNAFRLNINGFIQARWIFNRQSDAVDRNSQHGFEIARTRLDFSGHVVDQSFKYLVQGEFQQDGGDFLLLDSWIMKSFGENWAVLAGQFKVPVVREWTIDDPYQLAVNRSLVSSRLSAGRTQGIALDFRNDFLHFLVSYNDGAQDTGGFNTPWNADTIDYSFTGRVDVKLAGTWAESNQLTSFRGEEMGIVLGGGAHYQSGLTSASGPRLDLFEWSVDAIANFGGWNLFGAFIGRHLSDAASADIYAAVVQGGFFVTDEWELYGRYEWGDDDSAESDLSLLTVGTNYYFSQQTVKFTADFGYAFNPVAGFWTDDGSGTITGWRADTLGDDGQWVIRTQFQLMF